MKSWCYVATNAAFPHLVKVGWTERDPAERMRELNTTGVPSPFQLAYAVMVDNANVLERGVHAALKHCRHNSNREFFAADVEAAVTAIRAQIRERGLTIYVEDDVLQKVRVAEEALARRADVNRLQLALSTSADQYRQTLERRKQAVLNGPVPYASAWEALGERASLILGLLLFGGIGVAIVVNYPWTLFIAVPVALWARSDIKKDNRRRKQSSDAYQTAERQTATLESRLPVYLAEAERSQNPHALLAKFEREMETLVNPGKTPPGAYRSLLETPFDSETAAKPRAPAGKWLKTGNGLQNLNTPVHVPFAALTFVSEGSTTGYEVSSSAYRTAWIRASDVQDQGWTKRTTFHCPSCSREHQLDDGLQGVRLQCVCNYNLALRNGRLEIASARA